MKSRGLMEVRWAAWTLVLGGCAAPPSDLSAAAVSDWSMAWGDTRGDERGPPRVPDTLIWSELGGSAPVMRREREVLWLRGRIPAGQWRDPVLYIPRTMVTLDLYLDGARVFSYADYDSASGVPWHVVPLPSPVPEVVVVRTFSLYTKIGLSEGALVGERAAIVPAIIRADIGKIAMAVLFALVALISLLAAAFSPDGKAFVGVALFSTGLTLWTAFFVRSKQIFFPHMDLWFYAWWICVPWISVGLALFIEGVFGAGPRRLFVYLRHLAVALAVVGSLLLVLPISYRSAGVPYLIAHRSYTVLAFPVVALYLAQRWREDRDALIFTLGILGASVTTTHDVASSMGVIAGDGVWSHWGFALMDASLLWILGRRYRAMRARLVIYAQQIERASEERERIVHDLHDGLGGIATNIKLLAERARDDGSSLAPSVAIDTIADLAGDAVTEIRAFMRSLDDVSTDWRALAAELRHRGNILLEPHAVDFDFEAEIADGLPPPTAHRALNLWRIYNEALTNSVKHAAARNVKVELSVDSTRLDLRVADDGRGWSEPVTPGRGLRSMRTRAEQLGGNIEYRHGEGTTVHLRIPLQLPP